MVPLKVVALPAVTLVAAPVAVGAVELAEDFGVTEISSMPSATALAPELPVPTEYCQSR